MPIWGIINLQNRNSPLIEHLCLFHDHTIILITSITSLTLTMITISIASKEINRYFLESHETELFWTSLPAFLLIFIALPSIKTLYIIEELVTPLVTIKTIGYQWHWAYEYSNLINKRVTSIINNSLKTRLISVSNNLILPNIRPIRIIVTSKDVLHSWTIPSLGLKVDATPGRINQRIIIIKRPRIMVGQCSEICGTGHRFIPIVLESPNIKTFVKIIKFLSGWLKHWPLKPNQSSQTLE